MAQENARGQNNFDLLPDYKQHCLCRSTIALARRIQLYTPALWAAIQARAAKNELRNEERSEPQ